MAAYNRKAKFIQNDFQSEFVLYENYLNAKERLTELTNEYVYFLYFEIIDKLKAKILENKERQALITYDDLISIMHEAVSGDSINEILQDHYDVVFIDEFQDTDKKQYEIFSGVFGKIEGSAQEDKIIFFIGDPKQSIYGWRKADIVTYKKAKDEVDRIHEMNHNFRSTEDLINALNSFFSIEDPFADSEINYHHVAKGDITLGEMTESGQKLLPFAINNFPNNGAIKEFVNNEIDRLINSGNFQIKVKSLKSSDIAIITRTNRQAGEMKELLTAYNIPAIVIGGKSVLESEETGFILQLLKAIINPKRNAINTLLLNPVFGFNRNKIETLDEDLHLDIFRNLKKQWLESGVYNTLFAFLNTYGVWEHCLKMGIKGQRSLSNFLQIAEILHKHALASKCTIDELLVWLQQERDIKSEEYEQRIESEDDAVTITTIHKAKGLTYKVVFAPFLDLKIKEDVDLFDFRDEDGYKFTHKLTPEQEELWRKQTEQENRRLIYVALTRARYKVYICRNTNGQLKDSSLSHFLNTESELFEIDRIEMLPEDASAECINKETSPLAFSPRPSILTTDDVKVPTRVHSFSALNTKHLSAPFEKQMLAEAYDHFIFQELGRGASVGTALHSIFERLHFEKPESWEQTLQESAKYYPHILKEESMAHLKALLKHTMQAGIAIHSNTFRLATISDAQKLPELQFNFAIREGVPKEAIASILGEEAGLAGDATLQGLMTGFVDLLFEHDGKYYILDWKSNHLGNSLDDYNEEGLKKAMEGSNYTLQYLIYTVAVKRWLESRIPNFDYETQFGGVIYLFLRGIREGSNTGIFTDRPSKSLIDALDKALR